MGPAEAGPPDAPDKAEPLDTPGKVHVCGAQRRSYTEEMHVRYQRCDVKSVRLITDNEGRVS